MTSGANGGAVIWKATEASDLDAAILATWTAARPDCDPGAYETLRCLMERLSDKYAQRDRRSATLAWARWVAQAFEG